MFSTVSLMKEEPAVVQRFIDYYRALGAEEMHIFFDGPLDPLIAAGMDPASLAGQGVYLESCDEAFWKRELGRVPEHVQERLRGAFAIGHRRSRSDWHLIIDADEFLIAPLSLDALFDRIPENVDSVLIPPAEAIWGPGESISQPFGSTWFRRPTAKSMGREIRVYGVLGPLFRGGVLGYPTGKQFVRKGAEFDLIHQHHAVRDGEKISVFARDIDPDLASFELAHFDAVSFPRWNAKFHRRLREDKGRAMAERSPRRRLQIFLFGLAAKLGDFGTRAFCAGLYKVNRRQLRYLQARGLAFQADLFPAVSGQSSKSRA